MFLYLSIFYQLYFWLWYFFFSNCVKNLVKNFLYHFFFMRIELTFILFYTCWNVLITGVYFAGVEWRCDGKVCTDVSLPVYSTCVTLMSHAGILVFVDFFFLCVSFCKLQEVRLKKKSEQIWDVSFAFVSLSLFLSLIDSTFFYFFLFWYHLSSSSSSFFSLWFIFFSRNLFASVFIFVFSFFIISIIFSFLFYSFPSFIFFFLISLFVVWIFYVILFYFIIFFICVYFLTLFVSFQSLFNVSFKHFWFNCHTCFQTFFFLSLTHSLSLSLSLSKDLSRYFIFPLSLYSS